MAIEREQESFEEEPIRVKLGEEFRPFGNLTGDELKKRESPHVYLESDRFYVEGIGYGSVTLLKPDEMYQGYPYDQLKINILNLPTNNAQIIEFKKQLGIITVSIDELEQTIKTQPDITCTIKAGDIELQSRNDHLVLVKPVEEVGLFFGSFSSKTNPTKNDLLIGISDQNLKQLILRFDQNPNPS